MTRDELEARVIELEDIVGTLAERQLKLVRILDTLEQAVRTLGRLHGASYADEEPTPPPDRGLN